MSRLVPLVILLTWMAAGCRSQPTGSASLKLYVFDCGRLNYDSLEPYGIADSETPVRDLIVPCYVIEHEKGRLLWEGGLPSSLAEIDGWQEMEGGWRMRLDRTFQDQLADLDFGMSDFDYVSFSHFHFDHVGIANEVSGAKLILQQRQYEAAFADTVTTPGFSPELYSNLKASEKIVVEGDYDVFGDGRVLVMAAPGHTPGHQVLYLDLSETGPIVLSGDLYVFRVSRETQRVPTFDADPSESRESMQRFEAFLEERGAELWIGHDLARYEQLRKPPRFHQ